MLMNENQYYKGDIVRILTPAEYYKRTGVRAGERCALDYFANQLCAVMEAEKDGLRVELIDKNYVNRDIKYIENSFYNVCDYVWNFNTIELAPNNKACVEMSEEEFDEILFSA